MDKIKLCKDCGLKIGDFCHHRKNGDRKIVIDPVSGKKNIEKYYIVPCRYERQSDLPSFCGEKAKYYTPRKSLWRSLDDGWDE